MTEHPDNDALDGNAAAGPFTESSARRQHGNGDCVAAQRPPPSPSSARTWLARAVLAAPAATTYLPASSRPLARCGWTSADRLLAVPHVSQGPYLGPGRPSSRTVCDERLGTGRRLVAGRGQCVLGLLTRSSSQRAAWLLAETGVLHAVACSPRSRCPSSGRALPRRHVRNGVQYAGSRSVQLRVPGPACPAGRRSG